MVTQAAYVSELEHTATRHVQAPISYPGARRMIWPLASESAAARSGPWIARFAMYAGVAALLALFWLFGTTLFYGVVFGSLVLIVVWLLYTQARRHRIRDAGSTLATQDQHVGSGGLGGGRVRAGSPAKPKEP
jgi:hypothetical protein